MSSIESGSFARAHQNKAIEGDTGSEGLEGRAEGCPTIRIGGRAKSGDVLKTPRVGLGKPSNDWYTPPLLICWGRLVHR